jgi:hypothetical protein
MARLGSVAAAPFVGDQFVSLYLGATRVPTVPGKPTIVLVDTYDGDIPGYPVSVTPPANIGGLGITAWKPYINGVEAIIETVVVVPGNPDVTIYVYADEESGQLIQVSAINAVGEGVRSDSSATP